ncbi:hypothetical protein GcM1_141013, partial [Golovinomyces cichoracearum]
KEGWKGPYQLVAKVGETCKVRTDKGDIVSFRSTVVRPYFKEQTPPIESEARCTAMRMDNIPCSFEEDESNQRQTNDLRQSPTTHNQYPRREIKSPKIYENFFINASFSIKDVDDDQLLKALIDETPITMTFLTRHSL